MIQLLLKMHFTDIDMPDSNGHMRSCQFAFRYDAAKHHRGSFSTEKIDGYYLQPTAIMTKKATAQHTL